MGGDDQRVRREDTKRIVDGPQRVGVSEPAVGSYAGVFQPGERSVEPRLGGAGIVLVGDPMADAGVSAGATTMTWVG